MKSVLEKCVIFAFAFGGAVATACGDLDAGDEGFPDAATTASDGGDGPKKDRDASRVDTDDGGGRNDTSGVGPLAPCRKVPLDCLDPAMANVVEIPTEATLRNALADAQAGATIQVRGKTLGAGWQVPAYVTLRGCEGAKISGAIGFAGGGGTIEGFDIGGAVVATKSGSYVVRYNRFTTGALDEAGVSGRSTDALASASVTLVVDSNSFESRHVGVEARTAGDSGSHRVDITVRNNVFAHVPKPLVASNAGPIGIIDAKIEHNTFYDFDTAVRLTGLDASTSGNLFVKGNKGIEGSAYGIAHSFAWQVTTPAATPPLNGTFETGNPDFVDTHAGDFRLGPSSAVVDRIPDGVAVPGEDYFGCPRPARAPGAPVQSDVGAIESQRAPAAP